MGTRGSPVPETTGTYGVVSPLHAPVRAALLSSAFCRSSDRTFQQSGLDRARLKQSCLTEVPIWVLLVRAPGPCTPNIAIWSTLPRSPRCSTSLSHWWVTSNQKHETDHKPKRRAFVLRLKTYQNPGTLKRNSNQKSYYLTI